MPGSSYGRALWALWILSQALLTIQTSAGSAFTLNRKLGDTGLCLELLILAEEEVGE